MLILPEIELIFNDDGACRLCRIIVPDVLLVLTVLYEPDKFIEPDTVDVSNLAFTASFSIVMEPETLSAFKNSNEPEILCAPDVLLDFNEFELEPEILSVPDVWLIIIESASALDTVILPDVEFKSNDFAFKSEIVIVAETALISSTERLSESE